METTKSSRHSGFTLVELLIVITIIGMLMGLLIPAVNAMRSRARMTQCASNLKNVATALVSFNTGNRYLPFSRSKLKNRTVSWTVSIMPQLDQEAIAVSYESGSPNNVHVPVLTCPSNSVAATIAAGVFPLSYYTNCGHADQQKDDNNINAADCGALVPEGTMKNTLGRIGELDGLSNTALAAENNQVSQWTIDCGGSNDIYKVGIMWFKSPTDCQHFNRCMASTTRGTKEYARPSSYHQGGANVAFCDMRVVFLATDVDYKTYCQIMAPSDQKAAPLYGSDGKLTDMVNTKILSR